MGRRLFSQEFKPEAVQLVPCELPEARELAVISADWDWGIAAVELYEFLASELSHLLATLHPGARRQLELQKDLPAIEYLRRCRLLARMAMSAAARIGEYDVLVCPTSPLSPPLLSDLDDPEIYQRVSRLAARNCCVVNLLDMCALTMPVGLDPMGLPIGLQLVAGHMQDERLLVVGSVFERALGTGAERIGRAPLLGPG